MSYSGLAAGMVFGFVVAMLVLTWPLLTLGLRASDCRSSYFWPLCGAFALVGFVRAHLDWSFITTAELTIGVILSSAFIVGAVFEWVRETFTANTMNNAPLCGTLLLGACLALWFMRVFENVVGLGSIGAWLAGGVVCELVCHRLLSPPADPVTLRADLPDLGVLQCHREALARYPRPPRSTAPHA